MDGHVQDMKHSVAQDMKHSVAQDVKNGAALDVKNGAAQDMKSNILFWGACWGFAEATLGFLLHKAAITIPGLPGFVMFPVAYVLMARAVSVTGRPVAAFHVSWVAAGIKLLDFLVPGAIPLRVWNPAAALLMEGLAVWAVTAWAYKQHVLVRWPQMLGMAVAWRGIFLLDMAVLASLSIPAALITDGWWVTLRFLLLESAVNAVLITGWLRLRVTGEKTRAEQRHPSAWQTGAALALAVAAQLLL